MNAPELAEVNSLEETAEYLRITPNVLVNMARQGKIGSLKIGRTWTFPRTDVEAFVEKNRRQADAANAWNLTPSSLRRVRSRTAARTL